MDEERYSKLIEEATVDCYNEHEEFIGILYTLDEHINFPLDASVVGVDVRVIKLDDTRSSFGRGIIAQVERAGQTYYIGLAELEFTDLAPDNAEWIQMYQHWAELF